MFCCFVLVFHQVSTETQEKNLQEVLFWKEETKGKARATLGL